MKTILLEEAVAILKDCVAVMLDDEVLLIPSLADLDGEDDNEFLDLSWTDGGGLDFETNFQEGPNREVKVAGSSMFLTDCDGEELQITILGTQDLEGGPVARADVESRMATLHDTKKVLHYLKGEGQWVWTDRDDDSLDGSQERFENVWDAILDATAPYYEDEDDELV